MHETTYLTEADLACAKKYIERNSTNLEEFKNVEVTSNGEAKFSYQRVGRDFTRLTISYSIYESNKTRFARFAPQSVEIANVKLEEYADTHKRYIYEREQQIKLEELVTLLKIHPSQIEPTLQFLRSNLARTQSLQRGASEGNVTPAAAASSFFYK